MEASKGSDGDPRPPLDRERVIHAAVLLADRDGLRNLSMRRLASDLDVEAMSLYHHVANKEDILNGMIDEVFGEIELPCEGDWKPAIRRWASSTREALLRHRWAIGLMNSAGEPGPNLLRHHDSVVGVFRNAGFTVELTAHALAVMDGFIYGFLLQEVSLPLSEPKALQRAAEDLLEGLSTEEYPHLAELTAKHVLQPGYSFSNEFEYGLDLILEGLERRLGA